MFEYYLPKELIAQYPLKEREKARLMVLNRESGEIKEGIFSEIRDLLKTGDTLVLNNSRVIPARLRGTKKTGGKMEIFLLRKIEPRRWEVLLRGNIKQGQESKIAKGDQSIYVKIIKMTEKGSYIAEFDTDNDIEIFSFGEVPLPPYIKRPPEKQDESFYQTVYAKKNGSVAAPTAGLHFTVNILEELKNKGVNVVYITLHIGWASFKILKEKDKPGEEYIEITEETSNIINKTKESGNRVIAVGTSVVRALESSVINGKVHSMSGYTDLFIEPGFKFKVIEALITNFHLPASTHLYLVCAFAGTELIEKAYKIAIEKKYRFYSYGDCMLIL
ncbi:MAG: tRNA preQ1(34) S-adenosylmethionine ribosyltransferase-isomerase QueA [Candidatus Omnitrophica bacterium]|nr:tRNA preQ1(34) S-adenosylmethionine ribosyltransferase-isomerase QueA [Candidatus Omnitrophota bacterium]